jgi:hypothetical protein
MPNGRQFERKAELLISALLSEPTVELAAARANVPYRTAKEWLSQPIFRQLYAQARQEILSRTVARLLSASRKAVERLEQNLDADRPGDQIRAATAILDRAVAGVETLDLAERVRLLEERGAA